MRPDPSAAGIDLAGDACAGCGGHDHRRLVATLRHRERVLTEIVAVQRALARRAPFQQKLDLVTEAVARVLDVQLVGIRLVDVEHPDELIIVSGAGLDLSSPTRSPVSGSGVGGAAFRTNQTVCVDDYGDHPSAMTLYRAGGVRAAMAVPVQQFGRAIGSIVAATTTPKRRFDEADRETLRAFADLASIALTEQHLYDEMRQAYTDPLTHLANRTELQDQLTAALELDDHASPPAVLFIDLDGFKIVNDTLGHALGDELLVKVAERLRRVVSAPAVVGRFGGDEFLVLIPSCGSLVVATGLADRLIDALRLPIDVSSHDVSVTASIGIAWAGHTAAMMTSVDLLRNADTAMYRAKATGRGRHAVFEEQMYDELVRSLSRERHLREAIETNAMTAHFQPIVDLASGTALGAEALVRWTRDGTPVPPVDFIGLAEETGLILQLGRQVLRRACDALADWRHAGLTTLSMSVNLSMRELENPDLVPGLQAELARAGISPGLVVVELTESTLMLDVPTTTQQLTDLRDLGVRVAIDDFGTGYSSLARLRWLPIDILKIDRSFVDQLDTDRLSRAMASTVLQLADALGLEVVAEGVERESQRQVLLDLGCRVGQGFLFSRPLPVTQLTSLLVDQRAATIRSTAT